MGPRPPEHYIFPATMLGPEVQLFLLCGCHPKRPTIASSPVSGWPQVPSTLFHVLKIPRNLLDNHGIAPNCKTSGYCHVISFVIYSLSLLPVSHHRAVLEIPLEIQKTPFISEHQPVLTLTEVASSSEGHFWLDPYTLAPSEVPCKVISSSEATVAEDIAHQESI